MVYEQLTELDLQKINSYRNYFACASTWGMNAAASLDTVLEPWNQAKSGYLKKLFDDKLIISKPIEFKEDFFEIEERLSGLMGEERIRSFRKKITQIYKDRALQVEQLIWGYTKEDRQSNFVNCLFDISVLAQNQVSDQFFDEDHPVFELPIKDTILKVQRGMKPIRIITKIANAYGVGVTPDENGVSDLEYFRRRHSLGLNQKILKGELCLSIHPLDYMTMSDNDEGWDSCMSWENDGEYKQGTIEMMNSPCVVVAYLSAGAEKFKWGSGEAGCWNSKKWRSLFIVDPDFIVNIRSYPYDNDNLVKEVMKELSELAGWGRIEPQNFDARRYSGKPEEINGRKINIHFSTNAMYNDFGRGHFITLDPNDTEDIVDHYYNYSGLSECIWCGETDEDLIGLNHGTGFLNCGNCSPTFYCSRCESTYEGDDYYVTGDGCALCENCWCEYTETDFISHERYMEDDLTVLWISSGKTTFNRTGAESVYIYEPNISSSEWYELFTVDEPRNAAGPYGQTYNYVLVSDCTQETLERLGLEDEESLKDYLGENEHN